MVATKESFNNKKGAMETKQTWHVVKAFGKIATVCKNFSKGDEVNRTASKFNKIKFEEIRKLNQTSKMPFNEKSSFEKEGERQWNTDFIIDRIGHSTL